MESGLLFVQGFDLGKKCPTCLARVIEEVRKDPMGSYSVWWGVFLPA